jgi:predicted house-cleaning noncanonical NTP pyrophosphatase (MazG superfamily)
MFELNNDFDAAWLVEVGEIDEDGNMKLTEDELLDVIDQKLQDGATFIFDDIEYEYPNILSNSFAEELEQLCEQAIFQKLAANSEAIKEAIAEQAIPLFIEAEQEEQAYQEHEKSLLGAL